jgi:putative ABC transport system permease protein
VPGTRTITPDGLLNTVSGELGGITSILYGSSLAVTAVSVPLLGFISAMVAHERRKEIAILRALGATKIFILRLMLAESFTISIMGALAGVGIAALLILTFKDFVSFTLKIPFVAPSLMATAVAAGSALVLAVMIGGVAALYPALRVSRSEPYETMRKG